MFKSTIVFVQEFFREFKATGAVLPSSRWVAKELTEALRHPHEAKQILEVGPGSGPITVQILKDMTENDHLTICEINPRLMDALKEKLAKNNDYKQHQERVEFFSCAVQDLPLDRRFDIIVCAIPFLNLTREAVEEIFNKLRSLSHPQTVMTYIEYLGIRPLSRLLAAPERKARIKELDEFFEHCHRVHDGRQSIVWFNVPPTHIYSLRPAFEGNA